MQVHFRSQKYQRICVVKHQYMMYLILFYAYFDPYLFPPIFHELIYNSYMKKRVFAGVRASGRLHIGNYLGAVKGMLNLQDNPEYETIYAVADVHAITTPYIPQELAESRRNVIIDYLSAGLDPDKCIIFRQADVSEHIELAFYFSSVITIARMQHLPTFKDKVKQYPEHATMALLNYPVLMASDILLYHAGLVPAGQDQEPHLEVAREVARKMNAEYGTNFPEPVRFSVAGDYVPSLTGTGKMGKSVEGSYINLTDDAETVRKKIRSIATATTAGGEMTPGIKTLFTFAELYIPAETPAYVRSFENGTLKFVEIKDAIAEAISRDLAPFQNRRKELEHNTAYVDRVISEGAEKACAIARETITDVKEKMGLG